MPIFNYYGLIIMTILMVPNIIFMIKKNDYANSEKINKKVLILEQIGRYGSFAFMIVNIPYTYMQFYFAFGLLIYLIVNSFLLIIYLINWLIYFNKESVVKGLLLSLIPSIIFVFSSIMIASIPLFVFSILFSICHIYISLENAKAKDEKEHKSRRIVFSTIGVVLSLCMVSVIILSSLSIYGTNSFNKLKDMTSLDMINYDIESKNTKISVVKIKNGEIEYNVYQQEKYDEMPLYDYEIGSISKTYLGLIFAKLVEENKVFLNDNIDKYLELPQGKYYPTIKRLLTHTSGYAPYYFEFEMIKTRYAQNTTNDFYGITKQQLLSKANNIQLEDKDYPFNYSNYGISILGLVLESIYNDSYTNVMNNFIKNELQLINTIPGVSKGNLSSYWKWKAEDGYLPAGSIVSNIKDMASYLNYYLTNKNYVNTVTTLLSNTEASNNQLNQLGININNEAYTWMHDSKNGFYWHNGGTTSFNSFMAFNDDRTEGFVILSNLGPNEKIPTTAIGAKMLAELNG